MGSDPERASLVGGRDEPEEQWCASVAQRSEAEFADEDQVVAQQRLDDLPDGVVGQPAVEGVSTSPAVKYRARCPCSTAAIPSAIRVWDLPVPAG